MATEGRTVAMGKATVSRARHPLEKTERVNEEMEAATISGFAMLSYCWLLSVPPKVLSDEELAGKLKRLDLSFNYISQLPASTNRLANLREIWLSHNPISEFPRVLLTLRKLEVIDISHTQIPDVPTLVIDLQRLTTLDWRNTPLEGNLKQQFGVQTNDLKKLQQVMKNINIRNKACTSLNELLNGEIYLQDVDKPYTKETVHLFVEKLSEAFDNLEDFESFSRRPLKFIPAKVDDVKPETSAKRARELFYEMKRDIDRKRLAADLEIKIRGHYYDQIERAEVVTLIDSIYASVHSLEDMQFLVQYASTVLPTSHTEANGDVVWHNILALQDELIHKREAAIGTLAKALGSLYPEQKPDTLNALAREVNGHPIIRKERFATQKELVRMAQLAGDCAKVFPPDYAAIDIPEIMTQAKAQIFNALK